MFDFLSAAVVLAPAKTPGALCRVTGFGTDEPATLKGADVTGRLSRNPEIGLLDLVDAVKGARSGRLRLDRGRGLGWSVGIEAL